MQEQLHEEKHSLLIAFIVGVIIDTFLLLVIYLIAKGLLVIIAPVVAGHLILSIGLSLFKRGNLNQKEMDFITFGPLWALWEFFNICG